MTRDKWLAALDELFELQPGTLQGPELLEDLEGWNSLAMMSMIALADEHANLTLSPRQFINCRSVDDLLRLVCV